MSRSSHRARSGPRITTVVDPRPERRDPAGPTGGGTEREATRRTVSRRPFGRDPHTNGHPAGPHTAPYAILHGPGGAPTPQPTPRDHARFLDLALAEAEAALAHDDVPIGAVVVHDGAVVARAHNRREADRDPTAHAEILALREAARARRTWRLEGCSLYVTLEPCAMCAGAVVLARVDRLVFGADDPKAGAVGALWDIPRDPRLNHRVEVVRGVRADESGALLRSFFAGRRGREGP